MGDKMSAPIEPRIATRRSLLREVLFLAGIGCLPGGHPAFAHAALVRSDPSRRAVLAQPPARIRLWFNERIERDYSSISVVDAAGHIVSTGRAKTSPDDPKVLVLELPVLDAGRYSVHYRINSIDGHMVEASYDFTVGPAGGTK
jgi:copper resistance protein C